MYVHRVGAGPDVVLLHGWGMHSGVWEDVAESLMDDYCVTLVDLPGHGRSRTDHAPQSLDDLCRAVMDVTPRQATWIGWSLGGLIAQQIAITAPERVQKLVLVSSTPCFVQRPDWPHAIAPALLQTFADALQQDYRATLKRFLALEVHGSAQATTQLQQLKAMVSQQPDPDVAALAVGLSILQNTDLRADWPRLTCAVLLLLGQRDQLVPATTGVAVQGLLSTVQVHVFPHTAHAPFLSQTIDFLQIVRDFLHA